MAGSSGSGGSSVLALIVIGGVLWWLYSLIAPYLWTILGAVALITALAALICILYGHIAGASRDDNTEPMRRFVRRKYTWLGSFIWTALLVAAAVPTTIMRTDDHGAHVIQLLAVFGLGMAFSHGLGALLGHYATAYWKRRGAEERAAFSEGWRKAEARKQREYATQEEARRLRDQAEQQAARDAPGFGPTRDEAPESATSDKQKLDEEVRIRVEKERKRLEEEFRRRTDEEVRRRRADEPRGRSGSKIGSEQEALDYLGLAKPYDAQQLKSRYRQIIKKVHADTGGSDGMARLINEAYEYLKPHAK